jgi:hypothetical protein
VSLVKPLEALLAACREHSIRQINDLKPDSHFLCLLLGSLMAREQITYKEYLAIQTMTQSLVGEWNTTLQYSPSHRIDDPVLSCAVRNCYRLGIIHEWIRQEKLNELEQVGAGSSRSPDTQG